MRLRTRLVLSAVVVVVALAVGFVGLVVNQRRFLVDQIDKQLSSVPVESVGGLLGIGSAAQRAQLERARTQSVLTDLAVAVAAADGSIRFVVTPSDASFGKPSLDAAVVADAVATKRIVSVDATGGSAPFRVRAVSIAGSSDSLVFALSTARIEQVQHRFVGTGLFGLACLVGLMALIALWINRLGLRPISALTKVAEAQMRGDRTRRVEHPALTTEAGQLGAAFNLMLDERERAEQHLRTFVSDASHELRTPLTSIRGYLDLERRGAFTNEDERADAMRRIRQESTRMVGLVDDLLLLAQLDQGRPLTRTQVDLSALLGDLVHDTTVASPQRSIGVDIAPSLLVTGDPDRLSQVFTNLLRNAMVHTPVAAAVTITARRHDLPDHRVVVEVSDNGAGLSAEQAVQVFDRFYRGDPSRARDRGGAGLGLPIARSIVEAHGGRLTLRTEPGRGATFTVDLPSE